MPVVVSFDHFKQKKPGGKPALYPRPEGRGFTAHWIKTATDALSVMCSRRTARMPAAL